MKFGIFDHMDLAGGSLGQQYADRLALIEAYDRSGMFHAYHVAEHHSTPLGIAPSPGMFLAAVAQRTQRLRFGPMVYTLGLYHPLRLFEEICMLDQMSGGRLELGIGRGISPIEVGILRPRSRRGAGPCSKRRSPFSVRLSNHRPSSTLPAASIASKEVPVVLDLVQRPHPPLWYGVTKAGEHPLRSRGQGMNIACNLPPALARSVTEYYRAEWQSAGRDPAAIPFMGMTRHIVVAESDDEALGLARRAYAQWHRHFYLLYNRYGKRSMLDYPATFDELQRRGEAAAGSPATVRALLEAQIREAGVNYLMCRMAFGDLTLEQSLRSLELVEERGVAGTCRNRMKKREGETSDGRKTSSDGGRVEPGTAFTSAGGSCWQASSA